MARIQSKKISVFLNKDVKFNKGYGTRQNFSVT